MSGNPKIGLIVGSAYTGKSYAAGFLAARIRRPFVVIVSTHVDTSYTCHGITDQRCAFYAVNAPVPPITRRLLDETRRRRHFLYFAVGSVTTDERNRFLAELARAVELSGDLALFIDEAHHFLANDARTDDVERLIRGCRHSGVDVFMVSHGVKDIWIGYRRTLQQLIVFRLTEGHDLETLRRDLKLTEADERDIRGLDRRQFIAFDLPKGRRSSPSML